MTQSFVTQCPHCRTSFRVSLTQLGAAHGAVRCGACLHVFNAAQQLREQGQQLAASPAVPTPAPAPQPNAAPASNKANDTLWIHDDLDLDSLDLDEELAKLEAQEQQLSKQFLAIDDAPKYAESFLTPPAIEHDPHDERWAEALLQNELNTSAASLPVKPQPLTPPPAE
uniref:MJ0042-type zinc finger domain-containing protein n=1 Tax=Pseudomonas guineae TaxID=425504 RepID=UPI0030EDD44E